MIGPIKELFIQHTLPQQQTAVIPESDIIPGIIEKPVMPVYINPNDILETWQSGTAMDLDTPPVMALPVKTIDVLEKGKQYIQLGSYTKKESLESVIANLGNAWPLAVQQTGTVDSPGYRLLVGPLNPGDSNAVLQRLNGTYRDAFIRTGI
jgi:hypothetical protein